MVTIWVTCFLFILFMTWYINSRHKESASRYANEFLHPIPPRD